MELEQDILSSKDKNFIPDFIRSLFQKLTNELNEPFSLHLTAHYTFSYEHPKIAPDQKVIGDSEVPVLAELTPECIFQIGEGNIIVK